MPYRLSMAPRVARRFGTHLRPHAIALAAFFALRIGRLCVVVGILLLLSTGDSAVHTPVEVTGSYAVSSTDGVLLDPATPQGLTVASGGPFGSLAVQPATTTLPERVLAGAGPGLVWLCVGVAGAWLAPLLRRFAEGEPFAPGNARRLRLIAVAVLVATHVAPLTGPLATTLVLHRFGAEGLTAPWGLPVHVSLLVVLVLLLLAGALQQGRDLQDDVAGLV